MLHHIACALFIISALSAAGAYAGEPDDPVRGAGIWPIPTHETPRAARRPAALPIFYASLAALQTFDGYSSTRALAGGAHEANPFLKHIVNQPIAFWSVKAAMTVGPALAAERMWKHHKAAAIALMAVSNGVMAVVAAQNARTLNRAR